MSGHKRKFDDFHEEEYPEWQTQGFDSQQEWQDWLDESVATDDAYDAQAEAPSPDPIEEDEGFDEEFDSQEDSEDGDSEDDDDAEDDGPEDPLEPEDDSESDEVIEAPNNDQPEDDNALLADEAEDAAVNGFPSDINRDYALVEQTARGSLNAITSTLQDIIRRSRARQGDPRSLATEIESAFVTTLPTYRAAEALLQDGQAVAGASSQGAFLSERNQTSTNPFTAASVLPPPLLPSAAPGVEEDETEDEDNAKEIKTDHAH